MKIDEKYFVPFLIIGALVAALLIVFFTISSRKGREQAFRNAITKQDSLKQQYMPLVNADDSLRVQSFPDAYVIVDFWATWTADFSEQAHQQLSSLKKVHPDRLEILAAVVEDRAENVREYINRHNYPFHFVDGTQVFNRFNVGGVPTQLVYEPGGKLHSVFTGYADSIRLDSLKSIIENE